MITPLFAGYQSAMDSNIVFPEDSRYNLGKNKLLLSIHMLEPYDFFLNRDMDFTEFKQSFKEEKLEYFVNLYKKYTAEGFNVVIGEFWAVNKKSTLQRNEWAKYYIKREDSIFMS